MRKSLFAPFFTLLLLNATYAFAEVRLACNPLVSEPDILKALRGAEYYENKLGYVHASNVLFEWRI